MSKVDYTLDITGKNLDMHYQAGTLYTTSPKYFMKYYLCNEVEECGVYLSGRVISKQGETYKQDTNVEVNKQEGDIFVPTVTAQEAVDKYKTALKVVDVEEVQELDTAKKIWEKIRRDVIDIDKTSVTMFGLIWLFSNKSASYTAWLATLCLLCNMNLYEVVRMVKAFSLSDHEKQSLESEVWKMGLTEIIYNPVKREDVKLYMKVKDGNFKFK